MWKTFLQKHATGAAKIELHTIAVERGMEWEDAPHLVESLQGILRMGSISLIVSVSLIKPFGN